MSEDQDWASVGCWWRGHPGEAMGGDQESPWAEVFQELHYKVSTLVHFLPLGLLRTKALCKCDG